MPPEYSVLVFAGAAFGLTLFIAVRLFFYVVSHILSWMKGGLDDEDSDHLQN